MWICGGILQDEEQRYSDNAHSRKASKKRIKERYHFAPHKVCDIVAATEIYPEQIEGEKYYPERLLPSRHATPRCPLHQPGRLVNGPEFGHNRNSD